MQVNHHVPSFIAHVAEGVFNLGFIAVCAGEVVIAHRQLAVTVSDCSFVFPTHVCVRCYCEAAIFRAFGADEVAQRFAEIAAELVFGSQSRLEQYISAIFVGVECVDVVCRCRSNVTTFAVNLADIDDALALALLSRCHFFSCDRCCTSSSFCGCFATTGCNSKASRCNRRYHYNLAHFGLPKNVCPHAGIMMIIIDCGLWRGRNPDPTRPKSIRSDITCVFSSHARGARPVVK